MITELFLTALLSHVLLVHRLLLATLSWNLSLFAPSSLYKPPGKHGLLGSARHRFIPKGLQVLCSLFSTVIEVAFCSTTPMSLTSTFQSSSVLTWWKGWVGMWMKLPMSSLNMATNLFASCSCTRKDTFISNVLICLYYSRSPNFRRFTTVLLIPLPINTPTCFPVLVLSILHLTPTASCWRSPSTAAPARLWPLNLTSSKSLCRTTSCSTMRLRWKSSGLSLDHTSPPFTFLTAVPTFPPPSSFQAILLKTSGTCSSNAGSLFTLDFLMSLVTIKALPSQAPFLKIMRRVWYHLKGNSNWVS